MRELQRQHGRRDRGSRYDDARRPRFDRPDRGGGFRRESGPGDYRRRDAGPTRFDRANRDSGPAAGRTGFRPGGAPVDRGPRSRPDRAPRGERTGRPYPERAPRPDRDRADRPHRPHPSSAGLGPPIPVPAPETPPLARIRPILSSYQIAAATLAAVSLGVFREIFGRPQSAADVARACDTDLHGMTALLDALTSIGLLQRHGPTYVLPRELAPYFVPGTDGDATGLVELSAELYPAWGDLARAIREGKAAYPLTGDEILNGDPARVRRYIRGVHTVSREAALRVAQLAPLLPGSSLLDVAGGSGIFAATYARQVPDLTAHLFDLPPTIEIAREILRAEGLDDKVTYHAGDYRHDPLPGPVDTVLLSNVLQTESEEQAGAILQRSWATLRPGGSLLVHGTMPDAGAVPNAPLAFFSLLMFTCFGHGRAWSVEQVCEWLARERFGVRFVRPLGEPFQSRLILATRID